MMNKNVDAEHRNGLNIASTLKFSPTHETEWPICGPVVVAVCFIDSQKPLMRWAKDYNGLKYS